jgi:DNA invertase Pin-like site-specific DNA recombinase
LDDRTTRPSVPWTVDRVESEPLEQPHHAEAVNTIAALIDDLRDTVTLLDELDQVGVAFRSATEPFDTSTPMGRMLLC